MQPMAFAENGVERARRLRARVTAGGGETRGCLAAREGQRPFLSRKRSSPHGRDANGPVRRECAA
jgi:hypothetical protein